MAMGHTYVSYSGMILNTLSYSSARAFIKLSCGGKHRIRSASLYIRL
jgi:hypothetical protein